MNTSILIIGYLVIGAIAAIWENHQMKNDKSQHNLLEVIWNSCGMLVAWFPVFLILGIARIAHAMVAYTVYDKADTESSSAQWIPPEEQRYAFRIEGEKYADDDHPTPGVGQPPVCQIAHALSFPNAPINPYDRYSEEPPGASWGRSLKRSCESIPEEAYRLGWKDGQSDDWHGSYPPGGFGKDNS